MAHRKSCSCSTNPVSPPKTAAQLAALSECSAWVAALAQASADSLAEHPKTTATEETFSARDPARNSEKISQERNKKTEPTRKNTRENTEGIRKAHSRPPETVVLPILFDKQKVSRKEYGRNVYRKKKHETCKNSGEETEEKTGETAAAFLTGGTGWPASPGLPLRLPFRSEWALWRWPSSGERCPVCSGSLRPSGSTQARYTEVPRRVR